MKVALGGIDVVGLDRQLLELAAELAMIEAVMLVPVDDE